jgi:hypothetical protein
MPSAFSHRSAYTSSRPRKSDRNSATFSGTDKSTRADDSDVRTGVVAEMGLGGASGSACALVAGRAWSDNRLHSRAFSSRRRSHSLVTRASCSDNVSNSSITGPQSAAQNSITIPNASETESSKLHSAASLANGVDHSSGGEVSASGTECVARRPKVA